MAVASILDCVLENELFLCQVLRRRVGGVGLGGVEGLEGRLFRGCG